MDCSVLTPPPTPATLRDDTPTTLKDEYDALDEVNMNLFDTPAAYYDISASSTPILVPKTPEMVDLTLDDKPKLKRPPSIIPSKQAYVANTLRNCGKQPRVKGVAQVGIQRDCGICEVHFEPGEPAVYVNVVMGFICGDCCRERAKEERRSVRQDIEKKAVIREIVLSTPSSDGDSTEDYQVGDEHLDTNHLFKSIN